MHIIFSHRRVPVEVAYWMIYGVVNAMTALWRYTLHKTLWLQCKAARWKYRSFRFRRRKQCYRNCSIAGISTAALRFNHRHRYPHYAQYGFNCRPSPPLSRLPRRLIQQLRLIIYVIWNYGRTSCRFCIDAAALLEFWRSLFALANETKVTVMRF